jgi:hypothetical protein
MRYRVVRRRGCGFCSGARRSDVFVSDGPWPEAVMFAKSDAIHDADDPVTFGHLFNSKRVPPVLPVKGRGGRYVVTIGLTACTTRPRAVILFGNMSIGL